MSGLGPEQTAILQKLKDDFPHYAERCLTIRAKDGRTAPLKLNRAQRFVHARLEQQKAAAGKVRALILKARQQGLSTYVTARFFWLLAHRRGVQAMILSHAGDSAEALFAIVRRFLEEVPEAVRPPLERGNCRELMLEGMGSGWRVATAGAAQVGRGRTVQLLHGSEAAYWKGAQGHFAGAAQAVADLPGTEIIIESTANGPEGEFHARWRQAERGVGDYIPLFVPWFWTEEYRRAPPEGFTLEPEEAEHAALHGLDLAQMAWRRAKLQELKDPLLFQREYPATAEEAFAASGHDSFIRPELVLRARRAGVEGVGPLILGVDPKREGDDRFAMALRRGRRLVSVTSDPAPIDALAAAARVKAMIDLHDPARVFMDVGGPGGAIGDILMSWGGRYAQVLTLVNFGSGPLEPERLMPDGSVRPGPKNRRAEMWEKSRDWLESEGGVQVPDTDALQADACAPGYSYDLNQRLVLESKARMASRGARSPDEWDAVALTFAEPAPDAPARRRREPRYQGPYAWMGS